MPYAHKCLAVREVRCAGRGDNSPLAESNNQLDTIDQPLFLVDNAFALHAQTMATATRALRAQWLRESFTRAPTARCNSTIAHLQQEMPRRKIQPIFDDLSATPSYRLDMSLADYLPATKSVLSLSILHQSFAN